MSRPEEHKKGGDCNRGGQGRGWRGIDAGARPDVIVGTVGRKLVTMTQRSLTVFTCPGCGSAVEPGEDHVVAREYEARGDFDLHMNVDDLAVRAVRRFHVEHFRRRIGDYVYELVTEAAR